MVSELFPKEYKTIMIITKSIARDLPITPANNLGHFIELPLRPAQCYTFRCTTFRLQCLHAFSQRLMLDKPAD